MSIKQDRCLNCDSELNGIYCHNCGLKVVSEEDKSLKKLLGDFFTSFFLFENKFFKSFKLLFFKPALLPNTFISGISNRYIKPIQFFLIANLIYFIIPVETFTTSYQTQMKGLPYSDLVRPAIKAHIEKNQIDEQSFAVEFNHNSTKAAKLIIIIMVPLVGLVLYLLQRDKTQFFVTDHFTVSFYFLSFTLFVLLILFMVLSIGELFELQNVLYNDNVMSAGVLFILFLYCTNLMMNVYKDDFFISILNASIFTLIFIPLLAVYRFVLLLVTLAAMAV